MKASNYPLFTGVYFLLAAIVIVADVLELKWVMFLSKPIPLLLVFVFYKANSPHQQGTFFRNLLLPGFLFCALGDTLLMFVSVNENFFIAGLVAFLTGHILYSSAFITEIFKNKPGKPHWGQLAFATLLVVYGAEFYILNRFSFGVLWLPVLIYCIAITVMGVSATMRNLYHSRNGYFKVVAGAVLFIVSDSLLATNKFVEEFLLAGPLILSTYFMAQYFIATGCLAAHFDHALTTIKTSDISSMSGHIKEN